MARTRALRVVLISGWLLLVVGIVVAIASQQRFLAVGNRVVGVLEPTEGQVQIRREGLARWSEAVARQGLIDGDKVATGRHASGRISFSANIADAAGIGVNLGEETQIQVRTIEVSSRDAAYMVTLLRGSIVGSVHDDCADCPQLVIRAGDDTFSVKAGVKLGVFKPVGHKARKFDPAGPVPKSPPIKRRSLRLQRD